MHLPTMAVVDLSRWQFALTAMTHFIFVPLTLGLTWMLVIMEALYLKTGQVVYKDMVRFWGKLLAINFALGVVTGVTMEFEFGLSWSYFSKAIGGSFAPVLAIEGITAFMLESTMFGLFFFTWDKVSKGVHFLITVLMAFGASLSVVNILAANSWMQSPVATSFDVQSMGYQVNSILGLYLASLAQVRVGHVLIAGCLTGAIFVLSISAYYLLKRRDINFAKKSMAVAAGFGLVGAITIFYFGDQNGLQVSKYEPEKMAAIESQWVTQKPPAAWTLFGWPDQSEQKTYLSVKIPYLLSLIATHSLTGTVEGAKEIEAGFVERVKSGALAYDSLIKVRLDRGSAQDLANFEKHKADLGYGYLLTRYTKDPMKATPAQIKQATKDAIPDVFICFWSFRIMLACWGAMLLVFLMAAYFAFRKQLPRRRFFLWCAFLSLPLPYLAVEFGWVLAEVGRQPWVIHAQLPTFLATSSLTVGSVITSLACFASFYLILVSIEIALMTKFARLGPSSLHTGRYSAEQKEGEQL